MGGAGTIPPPPPTATPATTTTAPTATLPLGEAAVVALPERLQDLPRPVTLTGTVAGPPTPEGLTRIRTQLGEVLIDLAAQLLADKSVTLQIPAGQPPGKAQVFVNTPLPQGAAPAAGQTAAPPLSQSTVSQPAVLVTLPAPAPAMPGAPVPLMPGLLLPALVIAAAKPAPPQGAAAPSAATGAAPQAAAPATAPPDPKPSSSAPTPASTAPSPAATTPASAGLPQAAPPQDAPVQLGGDAAHKGADTPAFTAPPTSAPAKPETAPEGKIGSKPEPGLGLGPDTKAQTKPETRPGTGADAKPDAPPAPRSSAPQPAAETPPRPGAQPAPVLVQGATVALKVVSVAQPGVPAPPPPQNPDQEGPLLEGTVAGATPQGQPILATRQGMLALTNQPPLPPGTRVLVALTDPARAQQAMALHGAQAPSVKDWPALRQVIEALAAADPEVARAVANSVLPQPNKKLGAALTFLLSAMRAGDARGWLGEEATAALERTGQHALLKELEEEFRAPARPSPDAPAEWKPFAVPMMDGQALHSVQVHVRRVEGDEGTGGSGGHEGRGSRFLLDLELSRFGPLQLDGLVRPQRFDLILRSHVPLPPELTGELPLVFADSLGAMGFTGALSFQTGARNWVKLTRAGRAGLGVTA